MTITNLIDQLICYRWLIVCIIFLILLLLVSIFIMEVQCPSIINCTQSMATALVEGITNSLSSFDSKSINELVPSNDPVWILGEKYSSLHDMDGIKEDIRSRFWISYRRNFPRIDGTGPTSDYGWGCMLRCGQMVMSHALIMKHLGRHWRWSRDKNELIKKGTYRKYLKILSLFLDRKASVYSIHQIAQMGAIEGKPIGTWFGPNTICQALKGLADYDKWNKFIVYVCGDSLVIIDEIKETVQSVISQDESQSEDKKWRDFILFVPLRLGLQEMNPGYYDAIKNSFRLPQSLGIIGGRPNHALHFIGYVGNELIYLDPHTTQHVVDPESLVDFDSKTDSELASLEFDDSSYHTENAFRMSFSQLDPSLSMCFYFRSEEDFDSWCNLAHGLFVQNVPMQLFEIFKEKPYQTLKLTTKQETYDHYDYEDGTINVTDGCSGNSSSEHEAAKCDKKSEEKGGKAEKEDREKPKENKEEFEEGEEEFEILTTE